MAAKTAGDDELSEDKWIESLLAEAEQRLSSRASNLEVPRVGKQVAKPVKSTKVVTALPPARTLTREASKKQDELTVRTPQLPGAKKKKANEDDAGADWFNMPRTNVTPELLRDLKLLRMRDVLNPKQFFRKDGRTALVPTFSQVGTLVEGPTEGTSHRLTRKERRRTLAEEVLASSDVVAKFKARYSDIQRRKASGKKAHYKRLVAQRRKGR